MCPTLPIRVPEPELAKLCRRHHIARLSLFGSVLREDFEASSDVDVLAEFEPDATVTFFRLAHVQDELSDLLGRPVDLHLPRSLSPYLRDRVLSQARELYVALEDALVDQLGSVPYRCRLQSDLAAVASSEPGHLLQNQRWTSTPPSRARSRSPSSS